MKHCEGNVVSFPGTSSPIQKGSRCCFTFVEVIWMMMTWRCPASASVCCWEPPLSSVFNSIMMVDVPLNKTTSIGTHSYAVCPQVMVLDNSLRKEYDTTVHRWNLMQQPEAFHIVNDMSFSVAFIESSSEPDWLWKSSKVWISLESVTVCFDGCCCWLLAKVLTRIINLIS